MGRWRKKNNNKGIRPIFRHYRALKTRYPRKEYIWTVLSMYIYMTRNINTWKFLFSYILGLIYKHTRKHYNRRFFVFALASFFFHVYRDVAEKRNTGLVFPEMNDRHEGSEIMIYKKIFLFIYCEILITSMEFPSKSFNFERNKGIICTLCHFYSK